MNNKLKRLVKEIKFRKDWFTKDVAESIGYSREHLTKEMGKGDNNDIINLLLQKHSDILHDVMSDFLEESDDGQSKIKKEDLTMQALVRLTENNSVLVEAHNKIADSHKNITNSNNELVMMLKDERKLIAGVDSHTPVEIHATVLAMREFLSQIAAKVTEKTVEEMDNVLDKMTKMAIENLAHKDTAPADGKQGND